MRVLVTGATNAFGEAIVKELAGAGHKVRAFGVDDDRFAGVENVKAFPGWIEVAGSIEPVLAEREAVIHAACMETGKARKRMAVRIEQGTLYTVYGAEREQVDHFIHVTPAAPDKAWAGLQKAAVDCVHGIRGAINVRVVEAQVPADTAVAVRFVLEDLPMLGTIVGGNDNAVTE